MTVSKGDRVLVNASACELGIISVEVTGAWIQWDIPFFSFIYKTGNKNNPWIWAFEKQENIKNKNDE